MNQAAQLLSDLSIVDSLTKTEIPSNTDLVNAGRLFNRYKQSQKDIRDLMIGKIKTAISSWSLSEDELMAECRKIWASGYRPILKDEKIGSGSDVQDDQ